MRLKQREDELISGMQEALRTLYAQGKSKITNSDLQRNLSNISYREALPSCSSL